MWTQKLSLCAVLRWLPCRWRVHDLDHLRKVAGSKPYLCNDVILYLFFGESCLTSRKLRVFLYPCSQAHSLSCLTRPTSFSSIGWTTSTMKAKKKALFVPSVEEE